MQTARRRADNVEVTDRPGWPDLGFTLIELVVALTILAVAIFGIASVFGASIRTGAIEVHRSAAVTLASGASSHLRTISYDELGLPPGKTSPACDASATVVTVSVAGVTPSDPPVTIAGVSYTVNRCVVWQADSGPPGGGPPVSPQAYKRTTVLVVWTDQVGSHTVRQDTTIYPGGMGPTGGTTTTSTTVRCSSPPTSAGTVIPQVVDKTDVQLSWLTPVGSPDPIDHWIVAYSTDGFTTTQIDTDALPAAAPGQTNLVVVSALAPSTTYSFLVIAVAPPPCLGSGAQSGPSPAATATTEPVNGAGCLVGLVTVTPVVAPRLPSSAVLADQSVQVAASTNGSCGPLVASYSPETGSTVTVALSPSGTNSRQASLPAVGANEVWDLGAHTISILDGASTVAQASICVVNDGGTSC